MKFKIKYIDPETDEEVEVVKSFEDSFDSVVGKISAKEWAEDWAYAVSDKAVISVKEIVDYR